MSLLERAKAERARMKDWEPHLIELLDEVIAKLESDEPKQGFFGWLGERAAHWTISVLQPVSKK